MFGFATPCLRRGRVTVGERKKWVASPPHVYIRTVISWVEEGEMASLLHTHVRAVIWLATGKGGLASLFHVYIRAVLW